MSLTWRTLIRGDLFMECIIMCWFQHSLDMWQTSVLLVSDKKNVWVEKMIVFTRMNLNDGLSAVVDYLYSLELILISYKYWYIWILVQAGMSLCLLMRLESSFLHNLNLLCLFLFLINRWEMTGNYAEKWELGLKMTKTGFDQHTCKSR